MFSPEKIEQLDNILSGINIVFSIRSAKNNELELVYINDAYESIWGIPRSEVLKTPTVSLKYIHKDDLEKVSTSYFNFMKGNYDNEDEFRIVNANGEFKWLHAKSYSKRDENGEVYQVIGLVSDITDQKNFEDKINKLNTIQDNIIKMLAHDLKSPISGMKFIAELIENEIKQSKISDVLKHNEQIINSCDDTLKLMDDLLSHVKITSEGVNLSKVKLLIEDEIEYVCKRFEDKLKQKSISIQLPTTMTFVNVDKLRLHQILSNIISNAVKFSYEHGKIEINIRSESNSCLLKFIDYGLGIPEHLKRSVFDLFTKSARTGTQGEKSTGLGMSITKELIELHNGDIHLEDSMPQGTTVIVKLPL